MTVTIYGMGCQSTKKARKWMIDNEISFVERNIKKEPLTVRELQDILQLTIDGTDEILAKRSSLYRTMNLDIDELSLLELLEILHEQPRLLRSPIILDTRKLQVGYNEEEIRQFLPRNTRKFQWLQWRIEGFHPIES
ncbi:transcriptional regulator Spx [Bacillus sp. B15-48]|uniref:transcriptional regulator Spx n=1 Tax=Bacillus sp. B15-48 TaxID=1548601 RepID=UPI00193ED531|nr:transcriptional regulator Spx [Bacillus sp. B15-48]MBM4764378.1 Spx/MgsR family RNA polymerase-binding regulatory protein [Bacillus sp. B15-48]